VSATIMRADFQPTQPAPMSTLTGQAIDEFRVAHPAELTSLLRSLVDGSVLVQLSAPGGVAYTTVLWSVDTQQRRISLDIDPAHPQVAALIDAGEATAVAYLDTIKLQFDLQGLVLLHGKTASVLQAALPQVLYRFQRREYFRVRTREGAQAHFRHPAQPQMALALRVLDLSVGGCALAVPADVPPIAAGIRVAGVRIELDVDTQFVTELAVQHVSSGLQSPVQGTRLGCAFGALDGAAQRNLQRFIDLTQRRQNLRVL
jgi:c-di-GMP-binding flagellar brake protein YcgR